LNNEILKEIMLELNGKPSSVTTFSTDFSLQNLVFKKLFEFSGTKFTKNSIFFPHPKSKIHNINSIKFEW
jgi:hypothetical protein